jgi:hypothetical protein
MNTMRRASAAVAAAMLIAVWAAGAPAPIDRGVRLEWRFVTDRPFYQRTVTQTTQKMTVGGNEVAQAQKQTLLFRWVPVRQLPDRSWVVNQKIQEIQVDLEVAGNKITYDSTRPAARTPLTAFFEALAGAELTLTISPRKKVTKVEGRDALLAKIGKADPALRPMMEAILSESALKQMADPLFAVLPGKSVKKGERWAEESKLEMGGVGSCATLSSYVFEGPDRSDKNLGRIAVTQKLTFTPAGPGAGGALPFKVVGSDFKKAEGSGTIWVNLSKGRLERSKSALRLSGKMTIEIGGMNTDIDIDQKQEVTITTFDVLPDTKKNE